MEPYPKNRIGIPEIKRFIIIFYAIGFLGFMIPITSHLFQFITPLALLLCIYLLAIFSESLNKKGIIAITLVYISALVAEIIGVNTSYIFGNYHYGSSLGLKIWGTPLMIGINWVFLVYTTSSVLDDHFSATWPTILLAPAIMVGYDLVLERAASHMDMWYWEQGSAPLKNYISWYLLGVLMTSVIKMSGTGTKNPLSGILLASQFIFLLLIALFLK